MVQVLRHDIGEKKKVGTISEAYPHIILENFTSALGKRIANILKYLFPAPKVRLLKDPRVFTAFLLPVTRCLVWRQPTDLVQDDCKRIISLANQSDFISFRHHTYEMPKGAKSVELKECGPRFEMKLYQIRLGTMDQQHAENEWVIRAYMRSSKKAKLSEAEED